MDAAYWREEYEKLKISYDEYASSSKELEDELVKEIDRLTAESGNKAVQLEHTTEMESDNPTLNTDLDEFGGVNHHGAAGAIGDSLGKLLAVFSSPLRDTDIQQADAEQLRTSLRNTETERLQALNLLSTLDGSLRRTVAETDDIRSSLLSLAQTLDLVVNELNEMRKAKENVERDVEIARASEAAVRAELAAVLEEKQKAADAVLSLSDALSATRLSSPNAHNNNSNSNASTGRHHPQSPTQQHQRSARSRSPMNASRFGFHVAEAKNSAVHQDLKVVMKTAGDQLQQGIRLLENLMSPGDTPTTTSSILDVLLAVKAAGAAIARTEELYSVAAAEHAKSEASPTLLRNATSNKLVMKKSSFSTTQTAVVPAAFYTAPSTAAVEKAFTALQSSKWDALSGTMDGSVSQMQSRLAQLQRENAYLLSSLFKHRNNITVFCRVRPASADELRSVHPSAHAASATARALTFEDDLLDGSGEPEFSLAAGLAEGSSSGAPSLVVDVMSDTEIAFYDKARRSWRPFAFDRVFGPASSQSDVFREVAPLAQAVMEGYNACILAYGITSSGKTHTMQGPDHDPGLNVRILDKIFQLAEQNSESTVYTVRVSMLEIYNEELRNLLLPPGVAPTKLEVRSAALTSTPSTTALKAAASPGLSSPSVTGIQIPHLTAVEVTTAQEVLHVFAQGTAMRATAATNIHEHSSRSHCVLRVEVEGQPRADTIGRVASSKSMLAATLGKLYLVDLAGSERVRKSAVTGARLKEAQHINKSLSALGDVLEALDKKQPHVPYRNSKLTHLLQECLGGSARTLMMATVCPGNYTADESLYSLQFATRARNIDLGPAMKTVQVKNVADQYKSLRSEFAAAESSRASLQKELEELQRDKFVLEEKLLALKDSAVRSNEQQRKAAGTRFEQLRKDFTALQEQLTEERKRRAATEESHEHLVEQLRKDQHAVATLERDKKLLEQRAATYQREVMQLRNQVTDAKVAVAQGRRMGNSTKTLKSVESPRHDFASTIMGTLHPESIIHEMSTPVRHMAPLEITAPDYHDTVPNETAVRIPRPSSARSARSGRSALSATSEARERRDSVHSGMHSPRGSGIVSTAGGGGGAPPSKALIAQRERRAKREETLQHSRTAAAEAERRAKEELKKLARERVSRQANTLPRTSMSDKLLPSGKNVGKPTPGKQTRVVHGSLKKAAPISRLTETASSSPAAASPSFTDQDFSADDALDGFMIGIINPDQYYHQVAEPAVSLPSGEPSSGTGLQIIS